MTSPRRKACGFTLVEMVVVIVVTGIIAGVVAIFVARPVEAYVDSARRAQLTDAADTALRRVARDVRLAVPNSLRVSGTTFLEFIPTADGGRYRAEPKADGSGDLLDFAAASDASFEVLGPAVAAAAGDQLVIFNTGQASSPSGCGNLGADAYEGCNRRAVTGLAGGVLSFTPTGQPLPFDSPGHRFQIVPASGPVTYACEGVGSTAGDGSGSLRRYTGYGFHSVQATSGLGGGALLADHVSACAFAYVPGVTARNGLLTLRLTLTRSNESLTLHHEIHVDNVP